MAKPTYPLRRKMVACLIGAGGLGLLVAGLVRYPLAAEDGLYLGVLAVLGVVLGAVGVQLADGTYLGLEATAYYAAMVSLSPWSTALVAVWPSVRWALATRAGGWALLRNSGMYALMALGGASTYRALADAAPDSPLSLRNAGALLVALIVVRVINDGLLLVDGVVTAGLAAGWDSLRQSAGQSYLAEVAAYPPALLTALIYSQSAIRWIALPIWLLLFAAGALALQGLLRARGEADRRLAELSAVHAQMTAQGAREAGIAAALSQAADELAGYAARLAAVLRQQHAAVSEVTATAEQLTQQAGYIAGAAGAVDSTAQAALVSAGRGQEAATGSVQAMENLEQSVREMNNRMNTLEGRSRRIHRTVQTINNIAGETHLLALNATIEAAGAGEQGRRFSVVAQQINNLADQALHAAAEIQTTVREIEAATADTKQVIEGGLAETRRYTGQIDETRRSMDGILNAVGRASDMAQQIRLATEQQTQASTQVTDAMREILGSLGSVTTEGSAVSSAAENLRRLAHELRGAAPGAAPAGPAGRHIR